MLFGDIRAQSGFAPYISINITVIWLEKLAPFFICSVNGAKAPDSFTSSPLVKTNGKVKPTVKQAPSLALILAGTSEFIREVESKLFSAK